MHRQTAEEFGCFLCLLTTLVSQNDTNFAASVDVSRNVFARDQLVVRNLNLLTDFSGLLNQFFAYDAAIKW